MLPVVVVFINTTPSLNGNTPVDSVLVVIVVEIGPGSPGGPIWPVAPVSPVIPVHPPPVGPVLPIGPTNATGEISVHVAVKSDTFCICTLLIPVRATTL